MNIEEPLELIRMLKEWINENASFLQLNDQTELKERYKIVLEISAGYDKLGMLTPDSIEEERQSLEEALDAPARAQSFLQNLSAELTGLNNQINEVYKNLRSSSTAPVRTREPGERKAPPLKLRVTFEDGTVFFEQTATETFVQSLEYIGLESIAQQTEIVQKGHSIVMKHFDSLLHGIREHKGYYIQTHSGTEMKGKHLERLAQKFGLKIFVEVVDIN
jgi:hypothetical protein